MEEYHLIDKGKKILSAKLKFNLFLGLLGFGIIAVFGGEPTVFILGFVIIVGIYLYEFNHYKAYSEKLVLSKQNLEYYGTNFSFRTDWKNVESISSRWELFGKLEGLQIDLINIEIIKRRIKLMPKKILVPLSNFSEDWRNSELGHQIKQYAPHLFQDSL